MSNPPVAEADDQVVDAVLEPEGEPLLPPVEGTADESAALVPVREAGALAMRPGQSQWTSDQWAALEQLGLTGATPADMQVFLHTCQRTKLDPFAKQIYMISRRDNQAPSGVKWTIQTGIDGFRLIADRTGKYRGQDDIEWCGPDGVWADVWLDPKNPPVAARAAVHHADFPKPIRAVALFAEYAQTKAVYRNKQNTGEKALTQMWASKAALMIAKCAEALALRKAFPQDLAGLYTADEMMQADNAADDGPRRVPPNGSQVVDQGPPSAQAARRRHEQADAKPEPLPDDFKQQVEKAEAEGDLHELLFLFKVAEQSGVQKAIEHVRDVGRAVRAKQEVEAAAAAAAAAVVPAASAPDGEEFPTVPADEAEVIDRQIAEERARQEAEAAVPRNNARARARRGTQGE